MPAHETCVWMGSSPDAYYRSVNKRCQVHIGTIHAHHNVQMTNQDEFLFQSVKMRRSVNELWILLSPVVHHWCFVFTSTEKEDMSVWMIVDKSLDNFFHQLYRIYFSLVCSEGSNTNPRLCYVLVF